MAPRASSPALSENEFDISSALFGGGEIIQKDGQADLGIELGIGGEDDSDDDEAFIAAQTAASNRKSSNVKGKSVKKGGAWNSMGLQANALTILLPTLLKAIHRKGFAVPTPIQRKAIPVVLDGQDVVGNARTGSGKTAAFVIPLIEKLKTHSVKVGARALILSPSRELALQTLKVVNELGKGIDLRTILLVGGDSLEDQFNSMTTNPDIIIATPGRFLHLIVEMNLEMSTINYVVFDEADRLFELGFAQQLSEIVHHLPTSRQTLLFSATLPSSIVEFARAGLQDPKLIRLDAESKISPDLQSAFFSVKSSDRDGALLYILDKIIKMPTGETEAARKAKDVVSTGAKGKKRKRASEMTNPTELPTAHSTIVFAATKHRVEYLASLLQASGYAVSYLYGSLDQTARKLQIQDFRNGLTNVLVATDVSARGVDLPLLANVVQYDFTPQPKIFVHRVGRTARAGRKGWSYSLVRDSDVPYLIDLQLFLGRQLVHRSSSKEPDFARDIVAGSIQQDGMESWQEFVKKLVDEDPDLENLQTVASRGEAQYMRTRNSASAESVKRGKSLLASGNLSEMHPLFRDEIHDTVREREKMLAKISSFRPSETVFEIGRRGTGDDAIEVMRKTREQLSRRKQQQQQQQPVQDELLSTAQEELIHGSTEAEERDTDLEDAYEVDEPDSDSDLEVSIAQPASKVAPDNFQSEFFMSYQPKGWNAAEDRALGVHSGSNTTAREATNFMQAARDAALDFNNDEIRGFAEASKPRGMRWDKKSKKYVSRANDEDGSKGAKMIRGESGLKIAASFKSGRFDEWRRSNKIGRLPRTGETEAPNTAASHKSGRHYKHRAEKAPKEADRYRDDYHVQKKRVQEAKEKRIGKFRDGGTKSELKGIDDVRKQRKLKEKRREKNARPTKKRKA